MGSHPHVVQLREVLYSDHRVYFVAGTGMHSSIITLYRRLRSGGALLHPGVPACTWFSCTALIILFSLIIILLHRLRNASSLTAGLVKGCALSRCDIALPHCTRSSLQSCWRVAT